MYNTEKLNKLLLESFPELKDSFTDTVEAIDGIKTGSTIVYEDVFLPFIIESFIKRDEETEKRIAVFIEHLASSNDFDERNLIGLTVLDNIRLYSIEKDIKEMLGPNSKKLYDEWESR